MIDDEALKRTFDKVPELYEKARPHYPIELFAELKKQTGINAQSKIVEIGPGTGQATRSLSEIGAKVVAVELGPRLADTARKKLADCENVDIITSSFEAWTPEENAFDLVFSATAFHWIDSSVRYIKSHQLLKERGYLAVVHTNHVSDMRGDDVYNASQPIYAKYYKGEQKESSLPRPDDIKPLAVDESLFSNVGFWTFPLAVTYNGKQYTELLATFSSTLALQPKDQEGFLNDIETLVDAKFGGSVTKHFLMSMTIGRAL